LRRYALLLPFLFVYVVALSLSDEKSWSKWWTRRRTNPCIGHHDDDHEEHVRARDPWDILDDGVWRHIHAQHDVEHRQLWANRNHWRHEAVVTTDISRSTDESPTGRRIEGPRRYIVVSGVMRHAAIKTETDWQFNKRTHTKRLGLPDAQYSQRQSIRRRDWSTVYIGPTSLVWPSENQPAIDRHRTGFGRGGKLVGHRLTRPGRLTDQPAAGLRPPPVSHLVPFRSTCMEWMEYRDKSKQLGEERATF